MGAFHAYDIRGVYNVDFDKEVAYKVGYFLPELLSADKVLVGRDARVSSPEIHEYLLKGITDAGADVYATKDISLSSGQTYAVPLGFGLELPDGFAGFIFPRSGLSRKGIVCELPPID